MDGLGEGRALRAVIWALLCLIDPWQQRHTRPKCDSFKPAQNRPAGELMSTKATNELGLSGLTLSRCHSEPAGEESRDPATRVSFSRDPSFLRMTPGRCRGTEPRQVAPGDNCCEDSAARVHGPMSYQEAPPVVTPLPSMARTFALGVC